MQMTPICFFDKVESAGELELDLRSIVTFNAT